MYFKQINSVRISKSVVHRMIIPLPPHRLQLRQATTKIAKHQLSLSEQVLRARLQEWLASLADRLAGITIDIFLAHMRTPLFDHFLTENIRLVPLHKDLGDLRGKHRVVDTDKPFQPSKECLLMLLLLFNLVLALGHDQLFEVSEN